MTDSPIVLIHGLGSSFEHNWRGSGWVDLFEAEGREVIGFELPGHGDRSHPDVEPPVDRLAEVLAETGPADVVGFSAGAALTLVTMLRHPERFRRVALLGIGDGMLTSDDAARRAMADRLDGSGERDDMMVQLLRQMTATAGNDLAAVAAYARNMPALTDPDGWDEVDVPALIVLGEADMVGPADRLVGALPGAELLMLPRTDHFATTSNFVCLDAVLRFVS